MHNSENCLLSMVLRKPELFNEISRYKNLFKNKPGVDLLQAMETLFNKHQGFTFKTVSDYILETKSVDIVYFNEILDLSVSYENTYQYYLDKLIQENFKTNIIGYINTEFKNHEKNTNDFKYDIMQILNNTQTVDEKEIEDGKKECLKMAEQLRDNYIEPRIYSGIDHIEDSNNGLEFTDYFLIGGAESVGKTSFLLTQIIGLLKNKIRVLFFSCEMNKSKIYQLLACSIASINPKLVNTGMLDNKAKSVYLSAVEWLYEQPLYIEDQTRDWEKIKNKSAIMKQRHDINIILIDYLQYLRIEGCRNAYDRLEIISAESKELAKKLQVPIGQVVALNRDGKGTEPENNNIKGNGDIEYNADIIFLIWLLKDEYNGNSSHRAVGVKCSKNRNGELCRYAYLFKKDIRRFEKIAWPM